MAGWTRIDSEADVALRRAQPAAGLMAHASCEGKPPSRPLPVLARHLRFGLRNVQDLVETPAALDGVPVVVRALTLRGPGCVYDLVGVAPPDELAALAPDFERFTQSFALTGGTR